MEAYKGLDSVGIYLSGGPENIDPSASLGGEISGRLVMGINAIYTDPVQGLVIEEASPENGEGDASILIFNDTATYTPPDGLPGLAVPIAEGERKVLQGADSAKYVRVYREPGQRFSGPARFRLENSTNGVFSMDNVPDAERVSGSVVYRAVFLKGLEAVTDIEVWITSSFGFVPYALGTEVPASDGTIQTISDEYTLPAGVTFQIVTTEAAALDVGDLDADETIGLWVRRIILPSFDAEPNVDVNVHLRWKGE